MTLGLFERLFVCPRFKLALPLLKRRPLALEFTSAVAESTDVVQPWIQAGLLEIGLVRHHENMKLMQHRKVAPKCGAPHCGDGVTPPACCEHQGMCPLERTSSGWLSLARMHSKPEPEPEPVVKVPRSFVKMAVVWAAKDAGRDAVAMLRQHEMSTRPAEGVPPG